MSLFASVTWFLGLWLCLNQDQAFGKDPYIYRCEEETSEGVCPSGLLQEKRCCCSSDLSLLKCEKKKDCSFACCEKDVPLCDGKCCEPGNHGGRHSCGHILPNPFYAVVPKPHKRSWWPHESRGGCCIAEAESRVDQEAQRCCIRDVGVDCRALTKEGPEKERRYEHVVPCCLPNNVAYDKDFPPPPKEHCRQLTKNMTQPEEACEGYSAGFWENGRFWIGRYGHHFTQISDAIIQTTSN
uniref:Granulins domain-containing protein n=1 Tax=Chromera velia CCMP2878 TaxID=1169474 RepID=A0A0G4FM92_9ALVE|eukprot:Cvel_3470.t1-p1 / transcript=Cvel_3470.t1 / gene=Cvel_3470 / organism=Chromera_velia_CCMP2878 / gene_product=hypothetical protein / transcript_product=hypothetical protein / location=Cvel_scaffold140:9228-10237(-) / protein_length=239 / sequence_SO=supercontig / SO=protein_coding / is_pseudo=false